MREGIVTGLANHTLLIAKDGREVPIDDSAAPIRQRRGETLGVVIVFRDVTDQRRAQRDRAHLAAIVEYSGDAIVTKDLNGTIHSWNDGARRLFGYEAGEIVGKSITTLVPPDRLHEEDYILGRLRQGQPSERIETIRVAKDGRHINVAVSVSPLKNAEGEVIGASKIIHDVTDLVAAREALMREKELLATTLASIGDAVILTDEHGRVTFLNTEAERLTAWANDEARGRPLAEVFTIINEQSRATVENPVEKVMRLGGVVGLANHTILVAKDGREVPIDDSAAPIRQPGGPMFGIVLVFRDFTERKQVEEALREREQRFRTMADGAPVLIWLSGTDKLCTWFNRQWLEFTGRTLEQELGNGWAEGVHPDDFDRCLKTYVTAFDAREPFKMEYRLRRHDGEWRWVLDHGVPNFQATDVFVGYIGSCVDVTEKKEQEQKLIEQARLLDLGSDAIILTQWDNSILYWNRGAEELYGFTHDEAVGRVLHELLKTEFPASHSDILKKLEANGVWSGEVIHTCREGRRITVTSRWVLDRDEQGRPRTILKAFNDITDRKRFEQALVENQARLAGLINSAMDAVIAVDINQRIVLFNPAAEQMFGCVASDVIDSSLDRFIPAPQREAHRQHLENFGRTGATTRRMGALGALSGVRANGEEFPIEASISHMDLDGQKLFTVILRDISERKRVEAERERFIRSEQELRATAEEANRLKDEFLAIMSHELRNPLNVILGYSELLVRSDDISRLPQQHRMAEAIKRNARAQSKLICDLLDLSRLRSGKLELKRETVAMIVCVDNAIDTVRAEAEAKDITIEFLQPDESLFVYGDPVRIEQIVWNLLNNSVKFSSPGSKIGVHLGKEGEQVIVTVEDSGLGIDHSFLPHVFELFRQADASTRRSQSGMGIGLAVVQQLVDLHGGSISAYSAGLGKGATFTVSLPLSLEIKPELAPSFDFAKTLDNVSVLVVDDSEDTAEMLAAVLKTSGANVTSATSGNEALLIIAENQFDVVLSDISMPGMDGFEFLRHLRQLPGRADVPVLALTGFGRPEDVERAKNEGFFSHVTKPFDLDALMDLLKRIPGKKNDSDH